MASAIPAPVVAVIFQVQVTFDPKDRDIFVQHFKKVYDLVLAEPECAYFFVGENVQEPGVFRWTEGWTKDAQWFMAVQAKKPYYEPYLKATEPLFTAPRIFEAYTPLESTNHIKADLLDFPHKG